MNKSFYTVTEAAQIIGIGREMLRRKIRAGKIEAENFRGMYIISPEVVESERVRVAARREAIANSDKIHGFAFQPGLAQAMKEAAKEKGQTLTEFMEVAARQYLEEKKKL